MMRDRSSTPLSSATWPYESPLSGCRITPIGVIARCNGIESSTSAWTEKSTDHALVGTSHHWHVNVTEEEVWMELESEQLVV